MFHYGTKSRLLLTDTRVIEQRHNVTFCEARTAADADVVALSLYSVSRAQAETVLLSSAKAGAMTMWAMHENTERSHFSPFHDHFLPLLTVDLAVGFRRTLTARNYVRLPNWILRMPVMRGRCLLPSEWYMPGWPSPSSWRGRPGGTVYINRHDSYPRAELVTAFSSSSALRALGPFSAPSDSFNNAPWPQTPNGTKLTKREVLQLYKFIIAPENSLGDGYVTEKLFEAHLGGAIPIYWGAEMPPEPTILNPRRILFFNGSNTEALLQLARSLVTNSSARAEFFSHPVALPTAEKAVEAVCDRYDAAFLEGWRRAQMRRAAVHATLSGTGRR